MLVFFVIYKEGDPHYDAEINLVLPKVNFKRSHMVSLFKIKERL